MTQNQLAKFKIILTFISLGVLTSGLPTFILQAVTYYKISHNSAGSLESYQNLTAMVVSFIMFAILMKIGYRRSLIINYIILVAFCFLIPFIDSIWMIRLYLILIGVSTIVFKVILYSAVGLVTQTKKEHASFLNLMEAIYPFSRLGGIWMFSYFVGSKSLIWSQAFWVLSIMCFILLILWAVTPFDESKIQKQERKSLISQYKGILTIPVVTLIIFFILFACYVVLEEGVSSWLAVFYNQILEIPKYISIQLASLFTLGIAIGRILGAILTRFISWYKYFFINFILSLILIIFMLTNIKTGAGLSSTNIFNVPIISYGLPILGIFIGPLYPTFLSLMLTSVSIENHALMGSLILIAVAISSSISSKIVGILFGSLGGIPAFAIVTISTLVILTILILPFAKMTNKSNPIE